MIVFPNAKINLGLYVTSKLSSGYHSIETIMLPIALHDVLEIVPAQKAAQFRTYGLSLATDIQNNLCYKAWQLLKTEYQIPEIELYLYKNIPTGAGLGGGSSDAAFTLKVLNRLFDLKLPISKLTDLASRLGSDCAFFINNQPALATHLGEKLEPKDLPILDDKYLVLVKPELSISTQSAYSQISPHQATYDLDKLSQLDLTDWKKHVFNDFEEAIFPHYPELEQIKTELYSNGASYAAMSGSGSAVYGIFERQVDLSAQFPNFFYAGIKQPFSV